MDLAGPKLRTGPMAQGVQVCKIRPRRNALGALQKPAMVYLTDSSDPSCPEGAVRLPVADHWHKRLKLGDEVAFHDARGKARRLTIKGKCGVGFLAFSPATAKTWCGHTSAHIPQPIQVSLSSRSVATFFR